MSASDAVILLVADGFVAVGRVLRVLRRPSGAEVRAQAVVEADRLSEREAVIDSWEPDELWVPDGPSAFVWPESVGPKHGLTCRSCEGDIATCGCWDDDADESNPQRSAAVSPPAADNTRCAAAASIDGDPFLCCRDTGHAGPHNNPYQKASWIDAGADEVTAAELFAVEQAADNTTVDHLEAAYNYHRPQANYNGDLVWGCEGCNWHGATIQAHSQHRFHVLADMKNATHRIQEQLGGAS